MFKKYWILLVTAVIISSCSIFSGKDSGSHMMWEVRTPESTVFLVGSIHMADSGFYPLDNIYYEKLDSSKIFVTEVDMENIDPLKMMKLVTLRDGTKLKDHVPEDIYKRLGEGLTKLGFPEMVYEKFKPGFAFMMFQLAGKKDSPNMGLLIEGIDMHLLKKADKHDKLALEDIGTQMALLEKMLDVDADKIRMFMDAQENAEEVADLQTLLQAWKNADLDLIVRLMNESAELDEDSAKLMEELLDNRNKNMAKKINSYIVDGGKFYIVVGAAHLCGEGSIVELLEEMGYTVNQL